MARLLALDWDRLEARMIVARTGADGFTIDQVVAVPLDLEGQDDPAVIGEQLHKALSSQRIPKSQVLVAVGRSLVELRTMKLPPAPDDELPEMVRFQAMREFSSLTAESPLDFVPLGDAGEEPGEVMAAAIPADLSKQIEQAAVGQGHDMLRSVLRPCSATSLALRSQPGAQVGVTLVIAQQADSVELAIAKNGTIVFSRSFRLPPNWHPGETGEPLLGEVRRTIAAAQNQLGGASVDHIVMFGTREEHQDLCSRLRDRTKLDVVVVDPFEGVKLVGGKPDQPERYAALIGLLYDEAADVNPVINFCNPRKKPEPESNRRQHVLYTATAATVVLGLMFLFWWQVRSLNAEVRERERAINALTVENKKLAPYVTAATKLRDWKSSDKAWLDELLHLSSSEKLTADDFRLEQINARAQLDHRGMIDIRGRAKDLEARQQLQDELSDDHHDVVPGLVTNDDRRDARYPIQFSTTVQIERSIPIMTPVPPQQENLESETPIEAPENAANDDEKEPA